MALYQGIALLSNSQWTGCALPVRRAEESFTLGWRAFLWIPRLDTIFTHASSWQTRRRRGTEQTHESEKNKSGDNGIPEVDETWCKNLASSLSNTTHHLHTRRRRKETQQNVGAFLHSFRPIVPPLLAGFVLSVSHVNWLTDSAQKSSTASSMLD